LFYLGYGFNQPKPGKWVVTLQTTPATLAQGADFAIAAQFNGGAKLEASLNTLLPKPQEPVEVQAALTANNQPVNIDSAHAVVRKPDGSAETLTMQVNANTATLSIVPNQSGLYAVQVNVTAQTPDGLGIDRAAFLTFETQPAPEQVTRNQLLVGTGVIVIIILTTLIILAVLVARRRK